MLEEELLREELREFLEELREFLEEEIQREFLEEEIQREFLKEEIEGVEDRLDGVEEL